MIIKEKEKDSMKKEKDKQLEEIKNLIINKSTEILCSDSQNVEEEQFYKQLTQKLIHLENISMISNTDLLLGLLRYDHHDIPFDQVKKEMEVFKIDLDTFHKKTGYGPMKESSPIEVFMALLSGLETLKELELLDELIPYSVFKKKFMKQRKILQFCKEQNHISIVEHMMFFKNYFELLNILFSKMDVRNAFIHFFQRNDFHELYQTFLNLLYYKYHSPNVKSDPFDNLAIPRGIKRMMKRNSMENDKKVELTMKKLLEPIFSRSNELQKEKNKIERKQKKLAASYHKLLKCIVKEEQKDVFQITHEMSQLIEDEEIRQKLYIYALRHNEPVYNQLKEENEQSTTNRVIKLDQLFLRYQISVHILENELKEKIISSHNISEIEEIILKLNEMQLQEVLEDKIKLFSILKYGCIFQMNQILEYVKKGLLCKEFLMNYFYIFLKKEDRNDYCTLLQNMSLLLENRFDIEQISFQNPEILLLEHAELIKNIECINLYGFNNRNVKQKAVRYDLLSNPRLLDDIDSFIELDLYPEIKENLSFIHSSLEFMVKRIKISNTVLYPIKDQKGEFVSSIMNGKNFLVADEDLDLYIEDYSHEFINQEHLEILSSSSRNEWIDSSHEWIHILDQNYQINPLQYQINGILISRLKVMRNLKVFVENTSLLSIDVLYSSIIFNTTLSEEECSLLQSELERTFHSDYQKKRNS